jgi:hypothetical protein
MANASALKGLKKNRLGAPPPEDEASRNLDEPEPEPAVTVAASAPVSVPVAATPMAQVSPTETPPRVDARSLRRTHRTIQFATRVSPEFDQRIRKIAAEEGRLLVEVMERALAVYERERGSS